MSHDLRSKINVVLGYCDLVSEEFDEGAAALDDLAAIRRACDELLLLNDEIRLLLKEDRESPESGVRPLSDLASTAIDTLESAGGEPSITLEGGDDISLPASLGLPLSSLLLKTAYAFPAGARIRAASGDGELTLTVVPSAASLSSLESFASRYSAAASPDPSNDFDVFYLNEVYGPGDLETASSVDRDAAEPAVVITIRYS